MAAALRARQADEQPRQPVAHATQRRIFEGVARLRGFALDADEHEQVLQCSPRSTCSNAH